MIGQLVKLGAVAAGSWAVGAASAWLMTPDAPPGGVETGLQQRITELEAEVDRLATEVGSKQKFLEDMGREKGALWTWYNRLGTQAQAAQVRFLDAYQRLYRRYVLACKYAGIKPEAPDEVLEKVAAEFRVSFRQGMPEEEREKLDKQAETPSPEENPQAG